MLTYKRLQLKITNHTRENIVLVILHLQKVRAQVNNKDENILIDAVKIENCSLAEAQQCHVATYTYFSCNKQ